MGKRLVYRHEDDQREVRNSRHEACIPRSAEISQVPDSRRWFLLDKKTDKSKQPFCFEVNDAFAGLWGG